MSVASMSISEIMWVEKYRPKKIPDIVNQKQIIGSLTGLLKKQSEMPNLLFLVVRELERQLRQCVFLMRF